MRAVSGLTVMRVLLFVFALLLLQCSALDPSSAHASTTSRHSTSCGAESKGSHMVVVALNLLGAMFACLGVEKRGKMISAMHLVVA